MRRACVLLLIFSSLLFTGCNEVELVTFEAEETETEQDITESETESEEIESVVIENESESKTESEAVDENILGYTEAGREMCQNRSTRMKVYSAFPGEYIENGGERFSIYLTTEEEITVKEIVDRNRERFTKDVGQWETMAYVSFSWNLVEEPDPDSEDYYSQIAQITLYEGNHNAEICGMGAIAYHGELPEEDWETLMDIARACYAETEASITVE